MTVRGKYALAESDAFKPGDEAEYCVHVNEVRDGRATSYDLLVGYTSAGGAVHSGSIGSPLIF